VDGWSLLVTDTAPPIPLRRRVLEYGRVVLPMVVLAFGLLMTVWIVRREIALTSFQSGFVAAVTHEFKSPITSIRLLLERITSGRMAPGDTPDRYFDAIGAEADRLERLVNRLLEARKLQEEHREYRFRRRDIGSLVHDAAERLQPQADAKRMTLTVTITPDLPQLDLDAESMSDAVANLIDNAIKYSSENSRVAVSVDREDDRIRVAVTDEGIGVLPADTERIFEPFFRSRRGDQGSVHGTGLGLSLVKATAAAHGGTVSVESDGRRGSRFVLAVLIAVRGPRMAPDETPGAVGPVGPPAATRR
jgi:signal transduction histidine kinase